MNHTAEKLLTFIKESPTAFQAVEKFYYMLMPAKENTVQ